jgi:hypothetical protein
MTCIKAMPPATGSNSIEAREHEVSPPDASAVAPVARKSLGVETFIQILADRDTASP